MKKTVLIITTLYTLAFPLFAEPAPRPLTPIMGWSSWNHFRIDIDEGMIRGQADAMVSSGMKDAGYSYINIDDGYFGGRDKSGKLLCDPDTFPSGMKALADYIHSKELKAGIYSDAGKDTCATKWDNDKRGFGCGLYQHEQDDLNLMLKEWGYDFIKVDWCGGEWLKMDEQKRYTELGQLIRKTRPDVVYNICRWKFPGDWVAEVSDSWRISGDIAPNFKSICHIIDLNADLGIHAGPGHVNDMDMLQVGRGMTYEEDKAHFSMWCMMASPLLAGNDLRSMSKETIEILTNKELIDINQDPKVYQARRLRDEGGLELWARLLAVPHHKKHFGVAVALLNRSDKEKEFSFKLSEISMDAGMGYVLRDCWEHKTIGTKLTARTITRTVPAHGVVVLRVTGQTGTLSGGVSPFRR